MSRDLFYYSSLKRYITVNHSGHAEPNKGQQDNCQGISIYIGYMASRHVILNFYLKPYDRPYDRPDRLDRPSRPKKCSLGRLRRLLVSI